MKPKSKKLLPALFVLAIVLPNLLIAAPLNVSAQQNNIANYEEALLADYISEYHGDTSLAKYIGENYHGKVTVAIAASRPIANSRVVIDVNNQNSGHTFVRLDFGDGNVVARGFYAYGYVIDQILGNKSIKGELRDDSSHEWNAAIVYEITLAQANEIEAYMENFDAGDFRVVSNNCTKFAVDALAAAGIFPPTQKHKWTLPSRDEVIAYLPDIIPDKGAIADQLLKMIYYGYSPADAVQDFKSDPNCILKYDGKLHVHDTCE